MVLKKYQRYVSLYSFVKKRLLLWPCQNCGGHKLKRINFALIRVFLKYSFNFYGLMALKKC